LNAELEHPQVVVVDGDSDVPALRLPKCGKKGLGLDHVKITDGVYLLKSGTDDRTVRIDRITGEGSGRLQKRTVRLGLQSLKGSFKGVPVTGKGLLRLTSEGVAGTLHVNDDAAKEPEIRAAMGAARIT